MSSRCPRRFRHPALPALWLAMYAFAMGCGTGGTAPDSDSDPSDHATSSTSDPFTEITLDIGLPEPGDYPDGTFALPEIVGPGVALWDYDGDGDLDLLAIRRPTPGRSGTPAPNVLYEQNDDGRFVDVTARAGLGDPGSGHGVAIGDVDNDGDPDVYFTNDGLDALYLNAGDGTFSEHTEASGIRDDLWSTAASFCDYDRDGDLDLFVAHYVEYDHRTVCKDSSGKRDYCDPKNFDGVADRLYRNDGGGRFTDVTVDAGLTLPENARRAKGLGAVCTDLTSDGLVDIYVANDGEANQLWVNRGNGTFEEQGINRGVAVNRNGIPEASMGIAVGDVDGNQDQDLLMTHLRGENNTLYGPTGGVLFRDRTAEADMAGHDLARTGFGCALFDYDNDGDLDLAVANGRVYRDPVLEGARLTPFWNSYAEPNLLFENDGRGRFEPVGKRGGAFTDRLEVTRGLAVGDIDRDGDLDMVTTNVDGSIRVYRNDADKDGNHWIRVRAVVGLRDAIGAVVTLRASDRSWTRAVLPSSSFLSHHDPEVHFGLGPVDALESIDVLWPDGRRESFSVPGVDRAVVVRQGEGESS